jgi:ABC-type dipeptide/oligopeptide/nickel transport system permease subunit
MTAAPEAYTLAPHAPTRRQRGPLWFAWRRFAANRAAVASAAVLGVLLVAAVLAPLITRTGPNEQAFLAQSLAAPSAEHWFGVDDLGRDFFARIVYGARVSLFIGLSAAVCSVLIGIPLGALAGYLGGRTDWLVMRVIEVFSVVPPLLAAILLGALSGGGLGTIVVIAASSDGCRCASCARASHGVQGEGVRAPPPARWAPRPATSSAATSSRTPSRPSSWASCSPSRSP